LRTGDICTGSWPVMDAELQALFAKTEAIVAGLGAQRERNRALFPQHTLFVDRLEAELGKVRTLYVSEGGNTLGKPCTEKWVKW
jgi:hypothetical protein